MQQEYEERFGDNTQFDTDIHNIPTHVKDVKSIGNHVIVKPGNPKDTISLKGPGGKITPIQLDTRWEPGRAAIINGVVTHIPNGNKYTEFEYEDGKTIKVKYPKNIKVGDIVFFHFHSLRNPDSSVKWEGTTNLKLIPYYLIYCIIRDGKILMVGPWNLVEAVDEPAKNYMSDSGIMIREPKKDPSRGIVRFIGNKPHNYTIDYNAGDRVVFSEESDVTIKIGNTLYYRMKYKDILAVEK